MTEQISVDQVEESVLLGYAKEWSSWITCSDSFSYFENSPYRFSEWQHSFQFHPQLSISPSVREGFPSPYILVAFSISYFHDLSHSDWGKVKSQSVCFWQLCQISKGSSYMNSNVLIFCFILFGFMSGFVLIPWCFYYYTSVI